MMGRLNCKYFVFAAISSILGAFSISASFYLINGFINSIMNNNVNNIIVTSTLIVAFGIMAAIFIIMFNVLNNKYARLSVSKLKEDNILNISSEKHIDDIRNRLTIASETIIEKSRKAELEILFTISSVFLSVISAFLLNWIVGLVIFALIVLSYFIMQIGNSKTQTYTKRSYDANGEYVNNLITSLDLYYDLAYSNNLSSFEKITANGSHNLAKKRIKIGTHLAIRFSKVNIIMTLSLSIITLSSGLVILYLNRDSYGLLVSSLVVASHAFSTIYQFSTLLIRKKSVAKIIDEFNIAVNEIKSDIFDGDIKIKIGNEDIKIAKGKKLAIISDKDINPSDLVGSISNASECANSTEGNNLRNNVYENLKVMSNDFNFNNFKLDDIVTFDNNATNENSLMGIVQKLKNRDDQNFSQGELQAIKIIHMIQSACDYQIFISPLSNLSNKNSDIAIREITSQKNKTILVLLSNIADEDKMLFDEIIYA